MLNEKTVNVKMKRIELCCLLLATTKVAADMRYELKDENPTDDRKEILERSIEKWKKLHDMLKTQLDEFDEKHVKEI